MKNKDKFVSENVAATAAFQGQKERGCNHFEATSGFRSFVASAAPPAGDDAVAMIDVRLQVTTPGFSPNEFVTNANRLLGFSRPLGERGSAVALQGDAGNVERVNEAAVLCCADGLIYCGPVIANPP